MSSPTASRETTDGRLIQILSVAAVFTAFPKVTLSGAAQDRFITARDLKVKTKANSQIWDEQGNLLCITFLTPLPDVVCYTAKGMERLALETSRAPGY